MSTNLPTTQSQDSGESVKQFFNKYYNAQVSFPSNQIDGVVGFFQKRGFDINSARSTGIVILNQAHNDGVNAFQLLETLKSLTDVQLSQLVAEVLNSYRENTSILGYRIAPVANPYETRNILA